VFWVISVYFNIRNTLPKFCPFLLGHPVYWHIDHQHNHPPFNVTFYRIMTPTLIHISQWKDLRTEECLQNTAYRSVRKYIYKTSVLDASFSSLSKHRQNVFPVHTMKVYRGSRSIAPLHLNISTSWRQLQFTPWWLYNQSRSSEYPFYQRLDGPQHQSGCCQKDVFLLSEIVPCITQPSV